MLCFAAHGETADYCDFACFWSGLLDFLAGDCKGGFVALPALWLSGQIGVFGFDDLEDTIGVLVAESCYYAAGDEGGGEEFAGHAQAAGFVFQHTLFTTGRGNVLFARGRSSYPVLYRVSNLMSPDLSPVVPLTSFDMSSKTFGLSVISMNTVPTTQHSSPCLTSSTRSTLLGRSPPNLTFS